MNLCKRIIIFVALMSIVAMAEANPIPWPLPANMPLEDMYSYIEKNDTGSLRETFIGDYYFSYIPRDEYLMKYPIPPKSNGISVAMGKLPEDWNFSPAIFPFLHETQVHMDMMEWYHIRELYPTILPEWPDIPMIAWNGPFPEKAILSVKYQHDLLRREESYVYFYALGTGKYHETYQKEAISFLDISMPLKYNMDRLFLDKTPHAFAVTHEKDTAGKNRTIISIYASSQFGPFTKDVIGHIRPKGKNNVMANIPPQIRLKYKVNVEECNTQPPGIKPSVVSLDRKMVVNDQIYFNCCPEYIRMTILVDGNRVIFREKAMEKDPCDCNCYYPMKGLAGPFPPGTYQVELIDPYGKKLLEKEIIIN